MCWFRIFWQLINLQMKNLLILASALILMSCGTNKFLTSSVTPDEITELSYFEPISYIQYIEKGNKSMPSDSLSGITSYLLDSLFTKNKPGMKLSEEIVIKDKTQNAKVEKEIGDMAQLIMQKKKLDGIPLAPAIDSIMESNNQRFALATVATGFGRRKGNYGGQIAKGVGVGILTLGMVVPTPIKSNLTMYAFIFDSEKDQIAYYKRSLPVEKAPTDPDALEKQLISLFNGYFYNKK